MNPNFLKWLKTTAIAVIGGGVAGAFAAAMDPSRYHFPHDFGSGKLWDYFLEGAGLTFVALLIKSPLGQQVMGSLKEAQQTAKEDAALLDKVKGDLKSGAAPVTPPPDQPSPPPTK